MPRLGCSGARCLTTVSWPGAPTAPARNRFANYVFSRTLESHLSQTSRLSVSTLAACVAALKMQPGRDICLMGGGELAHALLSAQLVDEVGVNIHPELVQAERIARDCLYAVYRIRR
ncbi:MAG: dihydrofolate reductase family protein [Gemmatimonadota bacterium]